MKSTFDLKEDENEEKEEEEEEFVIDVNVYSLVRV